MSKGDTYRKVDYKKWSENYERIFGAKPQKEVKNEVCDSISKNEEVLQGKMVESPHEQEPAAAD